VAENEIEIAASPERVWAVLADAQRYADWVVGAQDVQDADASWPAPGSRLRHRTGVGPLAIEDETRVEEAEPPTRLVLHAKVGPAGAFRVTLVLRADAAGTTIFMDEEPVDGIATVTPGVDPAVHARNTISLERLKELAEAAPRAPSM
jgi:uncharacterized protein YndB with AHSA1/START domain